MPHFKCVPCRIRVSVDAWDGVVPHRSCPVCGAPLAAVGAPEELLGFRLFQAVDLPANGTPHDPPVADITAAREMAEVAWEDFVDVVDGVAAQAVALPNPTEASR